MKETERADAVAMFVEEYGCGRRDAELAALALHPLEDRPAADEFTKQILERSRRFGKDVRGLRGNAVGIAAELAVGEYLELARTHRESHYVARFEDAFDHAPGPVAPPEAAE